MALTKCKIIHCFDLTISISVRAKKLMRKNSKEDKQTLEELNSAHRCSQAKCQLVQTSYIKRIELFLFLWYNKHLNNQVKWVCMGEFWPRLWVPGLSIGFEVHGDILKVDGYGGRRPPHKWGVWGWLMPPAGYRGRAPLGVQGEKPPEAKWI